MSTRSLLILKLGDTLPDLAARRGDFEHWFITALGADGAVVEVFDPRGTASFPDLDRLAGIILTGSHAMVTERLEWSERTAAWVRTVVAAEVPILGVCYGHQVLAHALRGEVGDNPRGTQEGTTTIRLNPTGLADPLLGALGGAFHAQVSHTQSVLRLPPGAVTLGADDWDVNQAVRFGPAAWGVQFHPEMDADMTRAYVEATGPVLRAQGQDPGEILAAVRESPVAAQLITRFARLAMNSDDRR